MNSWKVGSRNRSSTFTGLNLLNTFNNRLQPNEIKASSTAGTAMDLTYSFAQGSTGPNDGHVGTITNNLDNTRTEGFAYDQVNRLIEAGTVVDTGSNCWGYQYAYDAWGNLLEQAAITQYYSTCTQADMGSVVADGSNHITGLSYDLSGNTQTDGVNTYTWNGESQLKTAGGVTYSYDGDGRRAAKVGSKLYWYGSGGEILAETDAAGNTQNEYIFFGGKRVAVLPAAGSALYYSEDMLGSSRVIVQSNGTVCYDADFVPFGGERTITATCAQTYKFEGKERDAETQNDDFGARYYSWRFGRWLSSDWSAVPVPVPYANLSNPQTLNLYGIVADDPESFADLDGHTQGQDELTSVWVFDPANNLALGTFHAGSAQNTDLKGPYVADLKSNEIAPLLDPKHKSSDSDVVGNGQCVTACSKFSGVTRATRRWRAGSSVEDDADIKPGTAIATFDSNGRYPTGQDKNSAIYLSKGTNGSIWVLDQWPAHPENNSPAHPPQPREIRFDDGKTMSNSANAYHVIMVAPE